MIYPIIICGDWGTSLWPISRKSVPKEFVPLVCNASLLQLTFERVAQVNSSGTHSADICIASEDHSFLAPEAIQPAKVKG